VVTAILLSGASCRVLPHKIVQSRAERQETDRFHSFSYDDLVKRDKLSLDIFWLRDESLEGADALPEPDVLAQSIVEDLQAALEQFAAIAADLGTGEGEA
jgi:type I restriction enzyme M protein